eukprot:CAMPEP_0113290622 /NCGR_PEP_ID=MMETSP0008_2-20120614/33559_1 /TAXON_ID=97485 /ORGANISM="Prymnesium parvum" /LENGTH=53 /DNA_ID=CAMNT_0000142371 /DNA_START=1 /DNA_END=159 /DNA_ORIENTATION=- /assembly_acc=CAM_ASM_000153
MLAPPSDEEEELSDLEDFVQEALAERIEEMLAPPSDEEEELSDLEDFVQEAFA